MTNARNTQAPKDSNVTPDILSLIAEKKGVSQFQLTGGIALFRRLMQRIRKLFLCRSKVRQKEQKKQTLIKNPGIPCMG